MKRAFVEITHNCYSLKTDFDLIRRFLSINGWKLVRDIKNADMVIVNTCAFMKEREDIAIELIQKVKKDMNKNAKFIVTGCLSSINKNRLDSVFQGRSISSKSLYRLDDIINADIKLRDIKFVKPTANNVKRSENDYSYPIADSSIYRLRIGWGCNGKCSYCVIRRVFGKPHSRPIAEILEEFKAAVKKGYRKFSFIATEVGCYGQDLNTDIVELLEVLSGQNGNAKFELSYINPDRLKQILPRLEKFIRTKKIWCISVPVQSGSDRILRLMKRSYGIDDFKYSIGRIVSINPGIRIETDIIVGFPSETEEDFRKSILLTEWLGKNKIYYQIFEFDSRPNTEASKLPNQLSTKEKQERFRRLSLLCKSSYMIFKNKKLFKELKRKGHIELQKV
ncbi:MAG: radical SAM protein [Candidatus Omnitrophota bacterium]